MVMNFGIAVSFPLLQGRCLLLYPRVERVGLRSTWGAGGMFPPASGGATLPAPWGCRYFSSILDQWLATTRSCDRRAWITDYAR